VNQDDAKLGKITNEVYPMLVEMCGDAGIDVADLVKELAAKQQLQDIRRGLVMVNGARTQ